MKDRGSSVIVEVATLNLPRLENPLGWDRWLSGLSVPAAAQPSKSAHRSRTQINPGHAPPESKPGHGGAVAPAAQTRLYPPPGESVPGDEKAGNVPCF